MRSNRAYGMPLGTVDFRPGVLRSQKVFEVVGVAKDIAQSFGIEKPRPAIYFPLRPADYAHPPLQGITLTVRSAPGVDAMGSVPRAAIGLAGVTAYSVAQRTREIGIRVALGARPIDVLGLVIKEGEVLVTVGTIIGLLSAWGGAVVLSSVLSSVARSAAPMAYGRLLLVGAPLLLGVLAMLACYFPARKPMRIDPVMALRQE